MPIVKLELVLAGGEGLPGEPVLQKLADELGQCLEAPRGETWVRLRGTGVSEYAESGQGAARDTNIRPTFASFLQYRRPPPEKLAELAPKLASVIATCLGRPVENTHLIFEPDGQDRVAFGGRLVR